MVQQKISELVVPFALSSVTIATAPRKQNRWKNPGKGTKMEFMLDDIEMVKFYCDNWKSFPDSYFGYDDDGNSTMVEVYPDYVFKETFLENVAEQTYIYPDGSVETTYKH